MSVVYRAREVEAHVGVGAVLLGIEPGSARGERCSHRPYGLVAKEGAYVERMHGGLHVVALRVHAYVAVGSEVAVGCGHLEVGCIVLPVGGSCSFDVEGRYVHSVEAYKLLYYFRTAELTVERKVGYEFLYVEGVFRLSFRPKGQCAGKRHIKLLYVGVSESAVSLYQGVERSCSRYCRRICGEGRHEAVDVCEAETCVYVYIQKGRGLECKQGVGNGGRSLHAGVGSADIEITQFHTGGIH